MLTSAAWSWLSHWSLGDAFSPSTVIQVTAYIPSGSSNIESCNQDKGQSQSYSNNSDLAWAHCFLTLNKWILAYWSVSRLPLIISASKAGRSFIPIWALRLKAWVLLVHGIKNNLFKRSKECYYKAKNSLHTTLHLQKWKIWQLLWLQTHSTNNLITVRNTVLCPRTVKDCPGLLSWGLNLSERISQIVFLSPTDQKGL